MKEYSIGIDLGGTRVKIGVVEDGKVAAKKLLAANSANELTANLPFIEAEITKLLSQQDMSIASLNGVGLAFPGIVNPKTKTILSNNKKYDDALDIDLEAWAKEHWGVPFFLDNDARMAAVSEWKFGAGRDTDNLVVMTIGTGIGTSAIVEGKVLRGKHFQAGCLGGHFTIKYNGRKCTCGNLGCVEAYGSAWSLKEIVTEAGENDDRAIAEEINNFAPLFDYCKKGNAFALRIRQKYFDAWAAGIINLIHAYDPEVVVLGGGVMNSQEDIIPYITEKVQKYAWCPWGKVQIRPTKLLSDAGILGVVYCLQNPHLKIIIRKFLLINGGKLLNQNGTMFKEKIRNKGKMKRQICRK